MNMEIWQIIAKGAFSGSILLILYLIYYEWKSAKNRAEELKIQLGEKGNEDKVEALSDDDLVDLVNKQLGPKDPSDSPPKK